MPFVVFTIGTGLMGLGVAFKVIQVTNRLTDVKNKEARKKIKKISIISIIGGAAIVIGVLLYNLLLFVIPADELYEFVVLGGDIIIIGLYSLIQYRLNPQNDKVLNVAAYGVLAVGFLMCLVYKVVPMFQG